jgi:hypothetical protein
MIENFKFPKPIKILGCIIPTYCIQSLLKSKSEKITSAGVEIKETKSGPIKVLGTTPGNSKWSY